MKLCAQDRGSSELALSSSSISHRRAVAGPLNSLRRVCVGVLCECDADVLSGEHKRLWMQLAWLPAMQLAWLAAGD